MELKYRPSNKITYANPRVYSRFIKQCMDPMNFATDKGKFRKSHAYINSVLESRIPIKIQRLKVSMFAMDQHLKAIEPSRLLYYTCRPDTRIHLVCLDIDPTDTTTQDDLDAVKDFLLSVFPGSFWDYGSSGKSLHYYLLIGTETLYNSIF